MHMYRLDPEKLVEALPHREPSLLLGIAQRLSIILWKDFVQLVSKPPLGDEAILSIWQELGARIQ